MSQNLCCDEVTFSRETNSVLITVMYLRESPLVSGFDMDSTELWLLSNVVHYFLMENFADKMMASGYNV